MKHASNQRASKLFKYFRKEGDSGEDSTLVSFAEEKGLAVSLAYNISTIVE